MKSLPCLLLDQIGHSPGGPQSSPVTQRLGAVFETAAQGLQLHGLQPRLAACPSGLFKSLDSPIFPCLMPPTDRLAVDLELSRYLRLAQALVKEFSSFESPLFQFIKITFDAFRIPHAQRLS